MEQQFGSLVLLMSIFEAKIAIVYVVIGLVIAVAGGMVIIVTLVNSIDDYGKWENICGKGRILPAFPGAGGSIKEDILDAGLTLGVVQPTTFAEISGKITGRVKKLSKLMKKSRIPYQVAGDMHKWQLCYLDAQIVMLRGISFQTFICSVA